MNVTVFGLGYVGSVTAACLARDGHHVVGVDTNEAKVEAIRAGRPPVLERGLDDLLAQGVAAGRLDATTDAAAAVRASDVSVVCVGTPSRRNGSLELGYVESVAREIGAAIGERDERHTLVVRSTVLPGTTLECLVPLVEEASGKRAGEDFGVAFYPEFLREGSALDDYASPPFVIVGAFDEPSGDVVAALAPRSDAPVVRVDIPTGEMVKYASNAFHGLKVAFANEMGRIAKAHGVDGRELMEVFCLDTQLNVSSAYLKPGNAFGGSCLPKDTRALAYRAVERDVDTPILQALLPSNDVHKREGVELVARHGRRPVGVLGLSFKPGTDDVRESPSVLLIEALIGRGHDVRVYDAHVDPTRLVGANKSFLETELPHIASLLRPSLRDVIDESEIVVVTQSNGEFEDLAARLRPDQVLVDLVGACPPGVARKGAYEGLCW
jgi:GDP-mannose 6-dehydrogenase